MFRLKSLLVGISPNIGVGGEEQAQEKEDGASGTSERGGNRTWVWRPRTIGNSSLRLGALWEESCKSFRSGMAMEGKGRSLAPLRDFACGLNARKTAQDRVIG
jgi:hypothetical protein